MLHFVIGYKSLLVVRLVSMREAKELLALRRAFPMLLLCVEHTGLKIPVLWGFVGKQGKDLLTVS